MGSTASNESIYSVHYLHKHSLKILKKIRPLGFVTENVITDSHPSLRDFSPRQQ